MHSEADGQDIPFSWRYQVPAGLAMGWTDQRAPSQCSARAWSRCELSVKEPTAVQVDAVQHDTPARSLSCGYWLVEGTGVTSSSQALPSTFRPTGSNRIVPFPTGQLPCTTATAAQETALSWLELMPVRETVGWTDHLTPSSLQPWLPRCRSFPYKRPPRYRYLRMGTTPRRGRLTSP